MNHLVSLIRLAVYFTCVLIDSSYQLIDRARSEYTLVNVYVDLVVLTRIAGTS